MKKLYVLFLLVIFFTKAHSQWVTIPDANFVAFLQQNYPQCMNGNQMDTTCSAIVNEWYLDCSNSNISDLTGVQYFDNLEFLNCTSNLITFIPAFPNNLYYIWCYTNILSSLPPLPNTLLDLYAGGNALTSLPPLPNSLEYLQCHSNYITSLPPLPPQLKSFSCMVNQLTSLPALPNSLISLNCSYNQITSLPNLPNNLATLNAGNNQLTNAPPLPASLHTLVCNNNQISTLPPFTNSLKYIYLSNNLISSLPELADTIQWLDVSNNINLNCLPQFKIINTLNIQNTNIHCLPNFVSVTSSIPPLATIPPCNQFNPNDCYKYAISGQVYSDFNNDCINDSNEFKLQNMKITLLQNGSIINQAYSKINGKYSLAAYSGNFTYTVDTTDLPVYISCPVSGFHTSILTPADSMDFDMDFAMQCKAGFDVGVKNIVRISGQFFPANYATIKIGAGDMASFYGLTCASSVSGSVIVDFTGPITYISEAPGSLIPVVNGNTLTYTISDFSLINFNSDFRFIVQTDTFAQAGNPVCFNVNVTPTLGDNDVTNNSLQHCFTVVNSFDPNAKEVYPEGGLTPGQEWMTYAIQFQNTGNAPAQNIYILDTLDQNLIPSSFTLLSYSHDPLVQLFGNVIKFNFPNINLPDSTNDEPNSHGFVQYKVRMVQSLPVGTVISNTAYNFFDFNPPVATNTVSNMVGVTSVVNTQEKFDFSLFPNPTTDEINISFNLNSSSEIKIKLYNSLAQVVKSISKAKYEAGRNLIHFSVADLPDGVYHLRFVMDGNVIVKRVVKM